MVHSGPEGCRQGFDAKVSPKDFYETYLPAFRDCVQEGCVEAVMGAYNSVNGEVCCGSKKLIEDILRGELGFEGHYVSDCGAITGIKEYHMAVGTMSEAAALALNSGCDLNCGGAYLHLLTAVSEGLVKEETIDRSLKRLFVTRLKLGIIGNETSRFDAISYSENDSATNKQLNLKIAEKSMTLLKNNGILPLDKRNIKKIAVIGPNADSRAALQGNYSGTASKYYTVLDGLRSYLGDDAEVLYAQGCHLFKDQVEGCAEQDDRSSEAAGIAELSDIVVLCLGLDATIEGEQGDAFNGDGSGDKPNLHLPGLQQHLLETAASFGKPLIVIPLAGSALALDWAEEHAAAVVHGSYPGALGGWALAQLIFGFSDFSGRLPVTFYSAQNHLPPFEDYAMQGRTYRFMQEKPLYPFGYGLGYTSFSCRELAADRAVLHPGEDLTLSVALQNTGRRTGSTVVQVYVRAPGGTPNAQLKKIRRATLCADEAQRLTLHLPPEAFDWFAVDGTPQRTAGLYTIYVGLSQPDERSAELLQQRPCALCLEMFLP